MAFLPLRECSIALMGEGEQLKGICMPNVYTLRMHDALKVLPGSVEGNDIVAFLKCTWMSGLK